MLNQVVVAGSFGSGSICEFANGIQLVIAGKHHGFLSDFFPPPFAVIDGFFAGFQKDKIAHNVQKAVPLEDVFPEVPGAMPRRMLGITLAAVDGSGITAPIERQEEGLPLVQAGCHMHFIGIDGKMNHGPFGKLKQRSAGITIGFILLDRLFPGLSGYRVFQFHGNERNAVQR